MTALHYIGPRVLFSIHGLHAMPGSQPFMISFYKKDLSDSKAAKDVAQTPQNEPTTDITLHATNRVVRVLLVEDDLIIQKIHRMGLEKIGCQVDIAVTGEEAISKAKDQYDLIFRDIGLPDKNGFEVTAAIRQQESDTPQTPIVVLTAYTVDEVHAQCLAAGADEVFTKPLPMAKFQSIIEKYS